MAKRVKRVKRMKRVSRAEAGRRAYVKAFDGLRQFVRGVMGD